MKVRIVCLLSSLLLGSIVLNPLPAKSQNAELHMNSRPRTSGECKASVEQIEDSLSQQQVSTNVQTFDVDRRFSGDRSNRAIGLSIEFRPTAGNEQSHHVARQLMSADRVLQTLAVGLIQQCESVRVVQFQLDRSDLSRRFAVVNNQFIEF